MYKLSVLMGVYNTPVEYLDECFDSLFKQTIGFENIEVCIFNDGSEPYVGEYLLKICEEHKNVIVKGDGKNYGLAHALNECLKFASSNIVARMDTDDKMDPTRFEKELNYLKEHNVDLVGCNANCFDENGVWGELIYPENITNDDFLKNSPLCHASILCKKEAYERVGGYHEDDYCYRNEDYDLFFRMQAAGVKLSCLQEKLYYFREDDDAYLRRKFKYRINEYKVRKRGYKLLKFSFKKRLYRFRPIIIGLLPKWLYRKLKRKVTAN